MNFELFFSISASRPSCNFHARTCIKAHEKSPQIYGYTDYSTNSPACQLFFSIIFHITFINPRICELPSPENRFFKGNFSGQAKDRMQGGGEKVAKNVFSVPFHGVDRSDCPSARIGDLPSVSRRVPILIYCGLRPE